MKKLFLCLGFGLLSLSCTSDGPRTPTPTPTPAHTNVYLPPMADQPMNKLVREVVLPRLEALIEQVVQQKAALTMDGVNPFQSSDQFLPGKVAIGFADLLLSKCQDTCPQADAGFAALLAKYRDLAHWVLITPLGAANRVFFNQTWGMYYYSNAIARLKTAGLVNPGDPSKDNVSAISAADLDVLKTQLEWRVQEPVTGAMTPFGFVNAHSDGSLANSLPTNYYGVAFGIARNRILLGWEDAAGADLIFKKLTEQFDTFSGRGYSDETPGEGRFDRYSLLVMGEVSQRLIETGVEVPPQLRTWLRNSVDGQLQMMNLSGNGFEYGRSLGPYADTSFLEVLSAAAYLNVLTADEKKVAYAFCTRVIAKFIDFWFDKDMSPATGGTVNMWKKGRRTDAYRAENRILGENLSLIHHLLYTTAIWNRVVMKDEVPMPAADFEAALGQRDRYHLITFTQAPNAPRTDAYAAYDRKALIVRDGHRVLTLPIVNGGRTLYAFNPYYPVPQSTFMLDATPDLAWPQLLPELSVTEADNTVSLLKPLAYFKNVTGSEDAAAKRYTLQYHQDELAKVTEPLNMMPPMADTRIVADTTYTFEPGKVTRADTYAAKSGTVALASIKMQLGTYAQGGTVSGNVVNFAASGDASKDAVKSIEVTGLGVPTIEAVAADNAQFNTNNGPLRSVVTWTAPATTLEAGKPISITWVLTYDPM